jgi:branched-chain amino acid transport system substrate-binding protein
MKQPPKTPMRSYLLSATASACVALLGARARATELLLGLAIAESGPIASFDIPTLHGLQIAIEEINHAGGIGGRIRIKTIIKDTRSDAAQTAIATQELVDDGVNVLVIPGDADPAIAASPIGTDGKVPMFTTASAPTLAAIGGDYIFFAYPADNAQATAAARYAAQLGYKRAYLLESPDSQYTIMPVYFREVFTKLGGSVVAEDTYHIGQQDFSVIVTKIRNIRPAPDFIYTAAYEPDFPSFIRQLRGAGIKIPVLGADAIDTPTIFALGDISEGVVFTTAGYPAEGSAMQSFMDKYRAKFGRASETIYDAIGYDIVKIIEAAVIAAKYSVAGPQLRNAIENLENVACATAAVTYKGQHGIPIRPAFLIRVSHGKREFVEQVAPDVALIPRPRMH